MSWRDEVEEIERRRVLAAEHGGAEAVARHHERGRLTIRERINGLADPGSFREMGPIAGRAERDADGGLVGFTPANYVLGTALVDGRRLVVGGEDFTQRGGSPSPAGLKKSVMAEDLACRLRLPLVRFLEGAGGSVTGTAGKGAAAPPPPPPETPFEGHRFLSIMRAMSQAPVASAGLGAVAGLPAARLVASHFAVMTRETAQVLVAGPAIVERALGEAKTKEELGGARVHARSGVVDAVADDEADAFARIRTFLGYLPTNVWESAPRTACDDPPGREDPELLERIPRERRRVYDARALLASVVDLGSFFELAPGHGRAQITGLARLAGQPVGVWANDPSFYAGSMTADGARKVRRFVDLCDTFHLPIVAFVDEPGFMVGAKAERDATIRHGAEALFAVVQSEVPWCSVMVRKCYGVAGAAHFAPGAYVIAWPSAESGALPLEGGVAVAFRREIAAAPDPEAKRRELEESLAARRNPFAAAEAFGVHDMIDPRRTRPVLCDWVESVQAGLASLTGPRAHSIRP
ncbi:MAG: propionyl-CoA carboxylase [Deltaproteobacteria bacterium]|nr:propionyl-CoA carboxylase [Deltaproteobacteria bacterium]MBW2371794.1 propionyl-CoA carboxylase [Deltaproteobacteria bacterium]